MDERSRRIEARLKLPVILPALLVIPLIVIGESSLGEPWESVGVALNWSKRRLFSPEGLQYTAALAALTAVAGGAGFAALEGDRSTAEGLHWAVTTMTTVGYGDELPTTAETKAWQSW